MSSEVESLDAADSAASTSLPAAVQYGESSSEAQSRSSSAIRSLHSTAGNLHDLGQKQRSRDRLSNASETSNHSKIPRRIRKPGGFLLGSVIGNGQLRASHDLPHSGAKQEQKGQIGGVYIGKRRDTAARGPGESSPRGSPSTSERSSDRPAHASSGKQSELRQPSLDAAQLVQMALKLSESRKRHVSNTLPLPILPAGGRRYVSALDSGYGPIRSASSGSKRASYANDSRIPTPTSQRHSHPRSERHGSPLDVEQNVVYTFSPATLSRAEKARTYFELASEHRRLLEHLPPLRPDATAPGNYSMHATSSPGSAHYQLTRITSSESVVKQKLGRAYNPLQALRDRRLRNRERRPLTVPIEAFHETDRIRRWIDEVDAVAKDGSYRPGEDQVRLPPFSGELEADQSTRFGMAHGHRRTDTASSVITRPETGWTIEPAELLADAYWVERGDNKTIVEDRHGNRIFPPRPRASLEVPRRSKEVSRRSAETGRRDGSIADTHSDSDQSWDEHRSRARHKHKHILPLPRLGRNRVSRSGSVTSASSDEGRKPPPLRYGDDEGGDENIGPLERHMREMIAKDEKGELSSPEMVSPDHWDSRNTPFPASRAGAEKSRQDPYATVTGRPSTDFQRPPRPRSVESRISEDHRLASLNEMVVDSPTSPARPTLSRKNTAESITSKQTSPIKQKTKGLKLSMFHSRSKSKEHNNIEATDFAANNINGAPLSPVLSAGSSTGLPRSSVDSVRHPQIRRHKTYDSIESDLRRADTTNTATGMSMKESKLSSNRFFKGGRVRDLVRIEGSRLSDRLRGSREGGHTAASVPQSEASDAEFEPSLQRRRTADLYTVDDGISSYASIESEQPKSKYFMSGLPSFKSPGGREKTAPASPLSEDSDPFEKLQKRAQSNRKDLPKINLPDNGDTREPEMSPSKSRDGASTVEDSKRRKSVSQNDLVLDEARPSDLHMKTRGSSTPVPGKWNWSISDHLHREQLAKPQAENEFSSKVTTRDIARVRALLLASGIKAHEIRSLADNTRDPPLPCIVKAAETAGRKFEPVARKEEHVVAAKILSSTLDGTVSGFEKLLEHFQGGAIRTLSMRLEELTHKSGDQLTKLVHETSDEADAFNVELTTKMPQDLKRMDETIDSMFRARRKNLKLLINVGSKIFEWLLLGIMWSVWFVVVIINSLKRAVVLLGRMFKWLLWW